VFKTVRLTNGKKGIIDFGELFMIPFYIVWRF